MKIRRPGWVVGVLISLLVLIGQFGCGAGSPSGPVQLPQTVEYMDGDGGDFIGIQTTSIGKFVVKDSAGEVLSPDTVTATVAKPDGTVVTDGSYGTVSISADGLIDYTAPSDFPSLDSLAVISFASNATGETLAAFDIGISVNPAQISSGIYSFEHHYVIDDASQPRVAASPDGVMNLLMSKTIDFIYGSYWTTSSDEGESFSLPYSLVKTGHTPHDLAVASDGTMAFYIGGQDGVGRDPKSYIIFKSGDTWAEPISFDQGTGNRKADVAFDSNGVLHVVYSYDVSDVFGVSYYYMHCTTSGCSSSINLTPPSSMGGGDYAPKIATYTPSDTALPVKVYVIWSEVDLAVYVAYSTISDIEYVSGTATLLKTVRGQDFSGYFGGYAMNQDVKVDRKGVPIVSWSASYWTGDISAPVLDSVKIQIARYNSSAGAVEGLTNISVITDIEVDDVPPLLFVSIDYSNYAHVIWYETKTINMPPPEGTIFDTVMKYSMGYFAVSGSEMTFTPAFTPIDINSGNISVSDCDATTDNAGRVYLTWLNRSPLGHYDELYLTVGNIK